MASDTGNPTPPPSPIPESKWFGRAKKREDKKQAIREAKAKERKRIRGEKRHAIGVKRGGRIRGDQILKANRTLSDIEAAVLSQTLDTRKPTADQLAMLNNILHQKMLPKVTGKGNKPKNLTKQFLKGCLAEAKLEMIKRAKDYVKIHFESTHAAKMTGDYETAAKHAEWMIEHAEVDGERLVEPVAKTATVAAAPQVLVGVNIGGVSPKQGVIDASYTPETP